MKWRTRVLVALSVCLLVLEMGSGSLKAQDDLKIHPACGYCGMDRTQFAHCRVHIRYDDDSTAGACSLHCAALDMALNLDKGPLAIQVGDFNDKTLIDAEQAVWVIGGDKMGVMTQRAKWAFETRAAAEAFVQAHGGEIATFEEALSAAYGDMYQDTRMIREKRKAMRMKKTGQGK